MTDNHLWWKDGIIYQVYPRSFQDTNADGIGDLRGIQARLNYLQDLGVDALWLSPVYPSPDADFGYDVADYHEIDPKFGSLADFDALLAQAHQRGIRVIMDLVLNHSSDQHKWFQQSRAGRDNAYADWYIWRDPAPGGGAPNNWLSVFGGPAWEYEPARGQYYYHMFTKQQPDLNWRNPAVREALLGVFRFWLERGVDGFRLDVFNEYFKDDQFRDNPLKPGFALRPFDAQDHIYDARRPEMLDVVREIRAIMDAYPERYVVGETFLASQAEARTYIGPDRLHAGFDFVYAHSSFSAKAFGMAIAYWEALHGEDAWPNYFLNNHDTPRSATRYARGEDDARLKLLAAMHLTLRGTPYLYYGEEIGMRDLELKRSQVLDPVGRRYWPFNKGRDACRGPMQWDASANGGFTEGEPWLPVHPDYEVRNAANQAEAPASLLNLYKSLIQLRRAHAALHRGAMAMIALENRALLAYRRVDYSETLVVVLNFSPKIQHLAVAAVSERPLQMMYAGNSALTSQVAGGAVHLPGYGFAIMKETL